MGAGMSQLEDVVGRIVKRAGKRGTLTLSTVDIGELRAALETVQSDLNWVRAQRDVAEEKLVAACPPQEEEVCNFRKPQRPRACPDMDLAEAHWCGACLRAKYYPVALPWAVPARVEDAENEDDQSRRGKPEQQP